MRITQALQIIFFPHFRLRFGRVTISSMDISNFSLDYNGGEKRESKTELSCPTTGTMDDRDKKNVGARRADVAERVGQSFVKWVWD